MPLESFHLIDKKLRHKEILAQGHKTVIIVSLNACDKCYCDFSQFADRKTKGVSDIPVLTQAHTV